MNHKYTTTWDLSFLYQGLNDPELAIDIDFVKSATTLFEEKYKGRLSELTSSQWLEFFLDEDRFSQKINQIQLYLHLFQAKDNLNEEIIKKSGELEHILVELSNKLVFVSQDLKSIGYDRLIELSEQSELASYRNYFVIAANSAKYTLSEEVEKALNSKSPASSITITNLYDQYVSSFTFQIEIDGEIRNVTEDEIRAFRSDKREEIRKKAFEVQNDKYSQEDVQIVLSNIYKSVVKDSVSDAKMRGYNSSMEIQNVREMLDNQTVELLVEQTQTHNHLFQRYLKAKAKFFGKEVLESWNIFAPIGESKDDYTYEEALQIVLDTFQLFDNEMYDYFVGMTTTGKVDVYPNKGKQGGAFCAFLPHFPSFVLLNFTGKEFDVLVIAHEFGHAYNGHKEQIQPSQLQNEPLSMAETASTFNETVIQNVMLESKSGIDRVGFLDHILMEICATIFRQTQYLNFERIVHDMIASGQEPTYQELNKTWRKTKLDSVGKSINFDSIPEEKDAIWGGIPHIFHTPFYVYSYVFGILLSFNLYEVYKNDVVRFREIYSSILSNGISKKPADILMECGFDINSKEFYQNGFKHVTQLVEEFEVAVDDYLTDQKQS